MPDTILLDTNILKDVSRGNSAVAKSLLNYLQNGSTVYISKAAYEELVTRAETAQLGGEYREMLKDLHIHVAPAGPMAGRVQVYADNINLKPAPNMPGQIREYDRTNDPSKPGDVFVAAQAKALNAKLWTLDEKLARRAPQFGVRLAPECSLKGTSGPENPVAGRQLLGLNPKPIGASGQVIPANKAGAGTAGTYAVVGAADNTLPEVGGPSPKGEAIIGGIQLALEGVNFVLNLINDHIQKKKVEEALDKVRGTIAQTRANNPRLGVLLLFYYTQIEAPDDSILKPGRVFRYLDWGKGVTRDEALEDATRLPTISAGAGPNARSFFQEVWIPPLQKTSITTARCPFPPIAIGRFALGNSTRARFQLVDFSYLGGFDDDMETGIDLPPNTNADFAVLKPPSEVHWYNLNGKQTIDVPLLDAKTFNDNTIKVVDLDPWSPFHAKAAMVFPVNDWTEEVFDTVSPTGNYHALAPYVNFSMIRWIRPANMHLLRFL